MHRNDRRTLLPLRALRWVVLMALLPRVLTAADYPGPGWAPGQPMTLYLEVFINGSRTSSGLVQVEQTGLRFRIESELLRRLNVRNPHPEGEQVPLDTLPGVSTEYDSLGQRLFIDVPPDWLPTQHLQGETREQPTVADGTGYLLNYDLYTSSTQNRSTSSLWTEARYFGPLGIVSSTGIYRRGTSGGSANSPSMNGLSSGFVRYDTHWTRTEPDEVAQTVYGDLVTGALPWSNAVRMGGVQWSRNFAVRPDLITYPLPAFAGQAAVPSAVDVFINGFRAANYLAAPGPFTLGGLPSVSGAGTASVVTTDAQGRQVTTSIPFYVSPTLLRPGWTDYSLSVGALRRAFGVRSFSYADPLASGVYRQGLSDAFTAEAQAQLGKDLRVAGVGGLARLAQWGVASLSGTYGQNTRTRTDERTGALTDTRPGAGWQWSAGYQYQAPTAGIALQQTHRTAGYADASTYAGDGFTLPRRTRQLDLYVRLGRGTANAGWLDQSLPSGQRNRLAYAGYSVSVGPQSFLALTAGRGVETGDTQLRLQFTYLLGERTNLQMAAARYGQGMQWQVNAQRNTPTDGGFGWSLGRDFGAGSARSSQASAQYRSDLATLQGGVYGTSGQLSRFAGATGSLGLMDGYAFASNRISDGFALVSTHGMADVPIDFNHQRIGTTNSQGYLLVTDVPAYFKNRYAIDPLTLPADVHTPVLERQVVVSRGKGTLVELPVMRIRTATITLVDTDNTPLPPGTSLVHEQGNVPTVVGWDGVVYLTALHARNTVVAQLPGGASCRAAFDEAAYRATRDLRVVCRPIAGAP